MRCTAPDRRTLLALLLLAAAPAPAEPPGLWTGAMQGAVPATLRGATVLATAASAKSWIEANRPTLLDVAPAPIRPQVMAPTMPWLPPAHQDLPGSLWLPGAGRAVLEPGRAAAFLRTLRSHAAPGQPGDGLLPPELLGELERGQVFGLIWLSPRGLVSAGD